MSARAHLARIDLFLTPKLKREIFTHASNLGFGVSEFLRLLARQEIACPRLATKRKMFGPPDIGNRRPKVMPTKPRPEQEGGPL
jgi:hypothetical protein